MTLKNAFLPRLIIRVINQQFYFTSFRERSKILETLFSPARFQVADCWSLKHLDRLRGEWLVTPSSRLDLDSKGASCIALCWIEGRDGQSKKNSIFLVTKWCLIYTTSIFGIRGRKERTRERETVISRVIEGSIECWLRWPP